MNYDLIVIGSGPGGYVAAISIKSTANSISIFPLIFLRLGIRCRYMAQNLRNFDFFIQKLINR